MDEKPPYRIPRFKLSTILVLTAIVAWAMSMRPRMGYGAISMWHPFPRAGFGGDFYLEPAWDAGITLRFFHIEGANSLQAYGRYVVFGPNRLLWPTLLLIIFLAGKWAWSHIERRRDAAKVTLETSEPNE